MTFLILKNYKIQQIKYIKHIQKNTCISKRSVQSPKEDIISLTSTQTSPKSSKYISKKRSF